VQNADLIKIGNFIFF